MADLVAATASPAPLLVNHSSQHEPPSTASALPRSTIAPPPTSSPSGIRGPRIIMMERAAREARQREEAQRQRAQEARAEEEARQMQEMRRRNADRLPAGAADRHTAILTQQHAAEAATPRQAHLTHQPTRSHQEPQSKMQASQPATMPHQQPPLQAYPAQASAAQQRRTSESQHPVDSAPAATETAKPRSTFPHAFERWETLSAHWEGLTSYWIRKLEQHKDDVNRDPLCQQLARQVTDLSAAGANLFHAVVELQRLRASSERKFQRWFFETRSELERAQEVNALLEKALEKERHDRSDVIRDALENERGASKTQKQIAEMRKELSISKEEARRAWEELGRREQEERDRTLSLQSGHPTIVGGVQVVPMTQSHSTRQVSSRDPGSHHHTTETSQVSAEHRSTTAPGSEQYGQVQGSSGSRRGDKTTAAQEADYKSGEYVLDAHGEPILDVHGRRIPLMAPPSTYSGSEQEAEEYETPTTTTNPPSGGPEPPVSLTPGGGNGIIGPWTDPYSAQQDYSGEGYGAPGWETVQRHHHPTRLSDVIEEDERSRASTGQMSRV